MLKIHRENVHNFTLASTVAGFDQRRRADPTTFFDLRIKNGMSCARRRASNPSEGALAELLIFRVQIAENPLILENMFVLYFTNIMVVSLIVF